MRLMSLHGLSRDAWNRYRSGGSWDYRILEAGYKYNLTDIASALGVVQLARAESMRRERERQALRYLDAFADVAEIELPITSRDRLHAWHLFPIRLRLDRLSIDRNEFIVEINGLGVGTSVHWRPLHLHPYYQERLGWPAELFPTANAEWPRRVTLPLFPGMTEAEQEHVIDVVRSTCERRRRPTRDAAHAAVAVGR
jgi:perosamine synthetase